ncbi:MAG: hypothetical protein NZM38_11415 [Cytophagales bacterium]|nr:hypothetical protein [Cytophagales bacterium]MDW8385365.1 hypothetical protein [Flammeovirgaceae bacterium]
MKIALENPAWGQFRVNELKKKGSLLGSWIATRMATARRSDLCQASRSGGSKRGLRRMPYRSALIALERKKEKRNA